MSTRCNVVLVSNTRNAEDCDPIVLYRHTDGYYKDEVSENGLGPVPNELNRICEYVKSFLGTYQSKENTAIAGTLVVLGSLNHVDSNGLKESPYEPTGGVVLDGENRMYVFNADTGDWVFDSMTNEEYEDGLVTFLRRIFDSYKF